MDLKIIIVFICLVSFACAFDDEFIEEIREIDFGRNGERREYDRIVEIDDNDLGGRRWDQDYERRDEVREGNYIGRGHGGRRRHGYFGL